MSANTKKIEKALLVKGLTATVTWTTPAGEDSDGGIDGYHSDQVQGRRYLDHQGQQQRHSGWLGYSVEHALGYLDTIHSFLSR